MRDGGRARSARSSEPFERGRGAACPTVQSAVICTDRQIARAGRPSALWHAEPVNTATRDRSGRRLVIFVVLALLVLVVLAALDLLPPGRFWYARSPMTAAAVSTLLGTVFGFLLLSQVVEHWLHQREANRLRRVATIAYRSLAQYVNDAGRVLLAPLVGADLDALAIPHDWHGGSRSIAQRLRRRGIEPSFSEATGSWRGITRHAHGDVLVALLQDHEFVVSLFRCAASQRRRLQEAIALWAPIMLSSEQTIEDLCHLRDMTDALEFLQERLRQSGALTRNSVRWDPPVEWLGATEEAFWVAITVYEQTRDRFAELAELPSDEIVARRG